jgi:hypothetical protein
LARFGQERISRENGVKFLPKTKEILGGLVDRIRGTSNSRVGADESAPPAGRSPKDLDHYVIWLTESDAANPFCVDGWNCLPFVTNTVATTSDRRVAESFAALRGSSGAEHVGHLPPESVEVACSLEYRHRAEAPEGAIFKASQMEEKWDIFHYQSRIYFCRSWTGMLVYVAAFDFSGSSLRVTRLWTSSADGHVDKVFVQRQVDYLIRSHLYGQRLPHPLPVGIQSDPQTIALYSFSQYGNKCCFGTSADTLVPNLLKWRGIRTAGGTP